MDGRKLSHQAREEIRIRAVRRVEAGESPEDVVRMLGFNRSSIYDWLARYREGGVEGLRYRKIPGRKPKLDDPQLEKLFHWITKGDPRELKLELSLWTRDLVRELIRRKFGVRLSTVSVRRLLHKFGLSPQRRLGCVGQHDTAPIDRWRREELPAIQRAAKGARAHVYFVEENTVRPQPDRGVPWAAVGNTPVVGETGVHLLDTLISVISQRGARRFMTVEGQVTAPNFITFLRRVLADSERSIFLIVDQHPVHRSATVRQFVDSTRGDLRLLFLPPHSPDPGADE